MLNPNLAEFKEREHEKLMAVIQKYQLTADQLEALCMAPALTKTNVQAYLNEASKQELAELFYTAGLVKLAETVEFAQSRHDSSTPNFPGPPTGSSAPIPDDGQSG